ncbi:hypothetical protein CBM2609_B140064 [Cupriavidus taiwanensis]|nr:hypothetical protein CBM2604_B150065 [Cupriavidus taiwanensis]SOZ32039.1 hypothetical protein CBM2609_B140064 [Cupriavidus taiwanensis]SOZ47686.1 hypothetical protein CBM2610_B120064 [Cupriavidus taiwanensis]
MTYSNTYMQGYATMRRSTEDHSRS